MCDFKRAALALISIVLTSCASSSAQQAAAIEMTICQIISSGDGAVGTFVRSSGIYHSDGSSYSFFDDPGCGDIANGIDVGNAWGVADFDKLNREWTQDCVRKNGTDLLCVVNAEVEFTGVVQRSTEGNYLVIDLKSIAAR